VTRGKSSFNVQWRYSNPVDRTTGLICHQTVMLTGLYSHKGFKTPLRRIRFKDLQTAKTLILFDQQFPAVSALTITELYRTLPNFTGLFGRWNCSSNGSNSIGGSKPSSDHRRTP
jgi:hypothetical protein